MSLQDLCLNISTVFSEGIEFGNVLSEIVIQRGQLDLGDALEANLEGSSLAGQLCSMVLLGEGNVYVELLTDLVTGDLLLKAGDEGAGAKLQVVVLALAAFKSDTVN